MSERSPFSDHWHRVASLRARLADDVRTVRHLHRGRSSHLLHRPSSGARHRVDSLAFDLLARLDGCMTVDEVWHAAQRVHGSDAPTQPEFLALLAALHEADLLVVDRVLDAERLFRRGVARAKGDRHQRLASPLYLRFRLCDPDRWLARMEPATRFLFGRATLLVWLALLVVGVARVAPERDALAVELAALGSPSLGGVATFTIVYALLKLVHELAHALTIKRFGGAVREIGIALMVLMPSPYTDGNAATLFPGKRERIATSAAGIAAELGLAALAALVWSMSTGLVHDVALAAMLIGGLSTLAFNGNPLLKFDAYHMLADWLEIPNLAERSRRHLLDTLSAWGLGTPHRTHPEGRERAWLIGYGLASSGYRVVLMLGIAWLLSDRYFFFGALLAVYVVVTLLCKPLVGLGAFLLALPPGRRRRGVAMTAAPVLVLALFVTLVPLPYATLAEGVVWLPERALVRAAHRCDVVETFVAPGTDVAADAPLLRCADAELFTARRTAAARVRELVAEKAGLSTVEPARYRALVRALGDTEAELALIDARLDGQLIRSAAAGRFTVDGRQRLLGRHFAQGDVVAYVVPPLERTLRVAIRQDEIDRVERATSRIEVALRQHPGEHGRFASHVVRRTPKPAATVPSAALTRLGGGRLAATASDTGPRLLEAVFDVELDWPGAAPTSRVGGAASVRFVHVAEPLAGRMADAVRRAFLGRSTS